MTHCKINDQALNDITIPAHFCPELSKTGNEILVKLRKKNDTLFLTKASVEVLDMKWQDQDKLMTDFENIQTYSDVWNLIEVFPEKTKAIKRVITRAILRLSESERNKVLNLLKNKSQRKEAMKICGNRTTTLICKFKDRDFCEGNSLSRHFGLVVLFAICLPGFVKGLSNLIFHQVVLLFVLLIL